jgi:hypothetical protein
MEAAIRDARRDVARLRAMIAQIGERAAEVAGAPADQGHQADAALARQMPAGRAARRQGRMG